MSQDLEPVKPSTVAPPPSTHTIHKKLLEIAAAEIARLPEHLEQLTPAERVRFVLAILPYTAPRLEKCELDFSVFGGAGW